MAFAHSHKGVHKIQELQNPLEDNSHTFQRETEAQNGEVICLTS